jgi:hypothetical protein
VIIVRERLVLLIVLFIEGIESCASTLCSSNKFDFAVASLESSVSVLALSLDLSDVPNN